MSLIKKTLVCCPHCGHKQEKNIYFSLNTQLDPKQKKEVENGKIFTWQCEQCGKNSLTGTEFLYHDPEKKFMVWFIPTGLEKYLKEHPEFETFFKANMKSGTTKGYSFRSTDSIGDLLEKVLIFNDGLNDIAMELCKYVMKIEISKPEVQLHYMKSEGEGDNRSFSIVFTENNEMKTMQVGYNVYQDCMKIIARNPEMKAEGLFPQINEKWIQKFMK